MSSSLSQKLTAPNGVSWEQPTGLFINNEFIASTGDAITTIDPATEEAILSVQGASADDVDKAVRAAHAAFRSPAWADMAATERGRLMLKLADLIEENKEVLAAADAWDNGKPYSEALAGDVVESYSVIRYYAGWADKIQGTTIPVPGKLAYTLRQPLGVVGQIIPWNYPLANGSWKLGPALACGNTVVLKASEFTPLSILILAKLIVQAGFPPGVVNIINGLGQTAGAALASHPLVDKVSFTGSTATGIQVMTLAAKTLKNITVETGGKSPLIVFDDCSLEQTVKWAHLGIMSNQGQICTATSRILVQKGIADRFVSAFIKEVEKTSHIGHQWDPKSYQGPQVSKQQYDRVLSYIETGKSEATLAYGGHPVKVGDGKGYFVSPTVFKDVKDDAKIWREEIFGPVVCIKTFETEAEAVELANDTTYGLASAVFTNDVRKSHRMATKLQSGMVWINSSQDSDFRVPFGGVKQSGIGRELGVAALDAYCHVKSVHVNMENDL
ncbi:hypothetical protein NLU13_5237 [Sarocladium strictum]|uniref:Aldehyde dehydrogenase domain-containing protein n=1 Tax=Sarocladium strictum TaxID=5046 RepID=A0AA39GH89_SARSR|nr:hypothetical protein NLU13_5237 [Sarocladium strictum]